MNPRVLGTVALTVMLPACAFVEVREVSRPMHDAPPGATADRDGYIVVSGALVALAARNERVVGTTVGPGFVVPLPVIPIPTGTPPPRASYFWLEVAIDPEGEGFTFDPREVRLRVGQGPALAPALVRGPAAVNPKSGRRASDPVCGLDPTNQIRAPERVRVTDVSCYALGFAMGTPGADEEFDVVLNGLANGDRPVPVPRVRFVKGSAATFGVFP